MAILETAILYKDKPLSEVQFYSSDEFLSHETRNGLLSAVVNLVTTAFDDEIQNFSIGGHTILVILKDLIGDDDDVEDEDKIIDRKINPPLGIYCIIDKESNNKQIKKIMEEAITQFINRFSIYAIKNEKPKKFQKFNSRLEKLFQALALKHEDRFKSIF